MPYITFSKSYSSSDDGSKLAGADIGQLQADIAQILNGGITNVNISGSAAIDESKLAFDTTSGHNHDGSNSRILSSSGYRAFIQGAELEWVSVATVRAQSGVLDIAGTLYERTSYSTTLNMATNSHWVEGTTQEGANQWVYIYAYNDSGSTWDIKFWLQAPQYANTGTDDSSTKVYRSNAGVWYRCLGAVRNDAGSNLLNFFQDNNIIAWDIPISITTTPSPAGWSAAVSCSSAIPAISRRGTFGVGYDATNSGANTWLRSNGSTGSIDNSDGIGVTAVSGGNMVGNGELVCFISSDQKIQHYEDANTSGFNISVKSFYINIR